MQFVFVICNEIYLFSLFVKAKGWASRERSAASNKMPLFGASWNAMPCSESSRLRNESVLLADDTQHVTTVCN